MIIFGGQNYLNNYLGNSFEYNYNDSQDKDSLAVSDWFAIILLGKFTGNLGTRGKYFAESRRFGASLLSLK